jgi:hypothetical protein
MGRRHWHEAVLRVDWLGYILAAISWLLEGFSDLQRIKYAHYWFRAQKEMFNVGSMGLNIAIITA